MAGMMKLNRADGPKEAYFQGENLCSNVVTQPDNWLELTKLVRQNELCIVSYFMLVR